MQPLKTIATIHTDFPSKFGIPRQGGLMDALKATVTLSLNTGTPPPCAGSRASATSG